MRIFKSLFIVTMICSSPAMVAPASASVVYDANLASPGVYFGLGNPNGGFAINTQNGVEVGIRAKIYQGAVPTPTLNVYDFALGDVISWDWSFNPSVVDQVSLGGLSSLMTITNVATGGSFSFNPFLVPDNATSLLAPGGFQNSWRLSFGFLNGIGGIGYNSAVNSTYAVDWNVTGQAFGSIDNRIVINQGRGSVSAVPEPATWAMMLFGFGLVGGTLRNRAQKAVPRLV